MSNPFGIVNRFRETVPVDVEGLARELGVDVDRAFLDEDISGVLEPTGDGRYRIVVNAAHPETRQRFTIAHEIGHFLLHRDRIGGGLDDDRAYRSTSAGRYHNTRIGPDEESEANNFAVRVLMPAAAIERVQRDEGLRSAAELARRFGVSEQSMAIRLKWMERRRERLIA